MGIQKYQALLKTIETGSITAAAQQLGYTQSAVSKMIQDLEQEWNVTLLCRGRKGVELTSVGISMLPAVSELVRDYENLQTRLSAIHGLVRGTLRLGCFVSVSSTILPSILKNFRVSFPGIQVQLFHGEYKHIADWLRKGTIDCGFLGESEASEFESVPVFSDSLVAVLPTDHPLAQSEVYPVERFAVDDYISLREEQDYDFAQFFDRNELKPKTVYEVKNDMSLLSMVESGLGVGLVYSMLLKANRYNVAVLPLSSTQSRTVHLACRRGKSDSIAEQFIACTLNTISPCGS